MPIRSLLVPILIAVVLLTTGSAAAARPNIVFILTDDMALQDVSVMPKLQSLVAGQGRPSRDRALRTSSMTYVEYETGERELYDLRRDPIELNNSYPAADRALMARLSAQLAALKTCSGATCRTADAMAH